MVHQKTIESHEKAGVKYLFKGIDEHIKDERAKCSNDLQAEAEGKPNHVSRFVNSMTRLRTGKGDEFILYEQQVWALTNLTKNRISWHEDKEQTSLYYVPQVEHKYVYDVEAEKTRQEIAQIASIETRYLIPFTKEEADKLRPFTRYNTNFIVLQEGGRSRAAPSYQAWLNDDFEELLRGSSRKAMYDYGYGYDDYGVEQPLNDDAAYQQELQTSIATAIRTTMQQQQQRDNNQNPTGKNRAQSANPRSNLSSNQQEPNDTL